MKILFLGDFYYDYDYVTDDIKKISKYIKDNNLITILNLEGTRFSKKKLNKGTHLNLNPIYIEVLKLLNVKAVNLANNHIMDYKAEGLKILLKELENANIGYFGAGNNLEEALKPYSLLFENKKICFGGYGWNMEECINARKNKPGTAPLNFSIVKKIIEKTKCDLFIPIFHFGYEYEKLPQPFHLIECRKLMNIDKVKIVIGHHTHIVGAFDNNIYYSLGNFYFGKMRERFYNMKSYSKEASIGIGVIFDLDSYIVKNIKFQFDGNNTNIIENVKLLDISYINNSSYKKYFYENNNFLNKKYVYNDGFINEKFINKLKYLYRNLYKKYLRNIKWPLIKKVKKILGGKNEN